MIIEVQGDILFTKAQAIVHGIAANDPMTQGLALQLHEKYPSMHKDFHHWCHQSHPKPGEAWMWGAVGGIRIVNLITQEGGYGHGSRPGKAEIKYVNKALRELKKMCEKENFSSIALPRIATGVGKLDWDEVSEVIKKHLDSLDIPVFVYSEYIPNQKANEKM